MSLLLRIILAVVVAALVALILIDLIGPWLVQTKAPFVTQLGDFLRGPAAYLIGFVCGLVAYFRGTRFFNATP